MTAPSRKSATQQQGLNKPCSGPTYPSTLVGNPLGKVLSDIAVDDVCKEHDRLTMTDETDGEWAADVQQIYDQTVARRTAGQ